MIEREPWPKPLPAPVAGQDPVAHLQRRSPSDRTLTQMVTVRVFGGEDDGAEIWVPLSDIRAVLKRAQRFRAGHWKDLDKPWIVQDLIVMDVGQSPLPMRMPEGWIEVGVVLDPWAGPDALKVQWHEASDKVRVQTPTPWGNKPDPGPPPPLFLTPAGGVDSQPLIVRARPGWVYWYRGRKHTPDEAERMVTRQGNTEGWTWEVE